MANPTTNFGWQMPTATDLVTDLPADFDVFGQAVDTDFVGLLGGTTGQVLAKASGTDLDFVWSADAAGMTNPMTTTGDVIYSSSGSTPARLGVGSTGQVLTVAAGVPSWATPGGAASFTELAATATTSGSTVTVSGLSGYNTLWVSWEAVGTDSTGEPGITIRFNSDTGSNYYWNGFTLTNASSTSFMSAGASGTTSMTVASQGSSAGNNFSGGLIIEGANTTGVKVGQLISGSSGSNATARSGNFRYTGSSVISSVSIITAAGTFDEGTLRVIGSVS
jgi:hypothetical protein